MLRTHALVATAIGLLVYSISIWATYHPEMRTTRLYWIIGMLAGIAGQVVWILLVQNLDDQRGVMAYAMLWDVGFTIASVAIPALLFRLQVSPLGYVGFALIACGGLIVKEFGLGESNPPLPSKTGAAAVVTGV